MKSGITVLKRSCNKNQKNHDLISYDELMDYGPAVISSLRKSMTLSINNEILIEGRNLKSNQPSTLTTTPINYHLFLLNDGNLGGFLSSLSICVILVGLTSKKSLERLLHSARWHQLTGSGAPDFGGQANVYLHDLILYGLLDKLQSLYHWTGFACMEAAH